MISLPRLVVVGRIIKHRYGDGVRPANWDRRISGVDVIETCEGERIELLTDGSQSTPKVGWSIVLTATEPEGVRWTLYGLGNDTTDHAAH